MARTPWQPKISHARFAVGAFSSEQMFTLGSILADSVRNRIGNGINGADLPSRPLKPAYAKAKAAKGRLPQRDWIMSGRTLASLQCVAANENRAQVSFKNPIAARIAHWNNLKERAFAVSPRDNQTIVAAVRAAAREARIVRVVRAA